MTHNPLAASPAKGGKGAGHAGGVSKISSSHFSVPGEEEYDLMSVEVAKATLQVRAQAGL